MRAVLWGSPRATSKVRALRLPTVALLQHGGVATPHDFKQLDPRAIVPRHHLRGGRWHGMMMHAGRMACCRVLTQSSTVQSSTTLCKQTQLIEVIPLARCIDVFTVYSLQSYNGTLT